MSTFTPQERDKLIVALTMEGLIEQLNATLAAREAQVVFDYSDRLNPKIWIQTPHCRPELWFIADHRRRKSLGYNPRDAVLHQLVHKIMSDLKEQNAYLMITTHRNKNQKIKANFQIHFRDVDRIVITLFSLYRGETKTQHMFMLPKELQ